MAFPKQKHANLIFHDGTMVTVSVKSEQWPSVITHRKAVWDGKDAKTHEIQFTYVGVQYGVGAYVEQRAG